MKNLSIQIESNKMIDNTITNIKNTLFSKGIDIFGY